MAKRRNVLKHQINQRLNELDKLGQSKSKDKKLLIQTKKYTFGDSLTGIYSIKTKENYRQVANQFTQFCITEKKENSRSNLDFLIKKYGIEYLKFREEKELSVSTLSRDRAALNKLIISGKKIDYQFQSRSIHSIKRSRSNLNKNNNHFNEILNKDLIALASGTGGRRSDLAKLKPSHFFEKDGRLYCNFLRSKGGKNRVVVIREEYRKNIEDRLSITRCDSFLFERIHSHADIHTYRRDYAKGLYKDILRDSDLKRALESLYGERNEVGIVSESYKTKGEDNFFSGLRDDLFIITKSLGHNRLDVAVNHYLR